MWWLVGLVLSKRVKGSGKYNSDYLYVTDFGFQAGGTVNFTWASETGTPLAARLYCFDYMQYDTWTTQMFMTDDFRTCPNEPHENIFYWDAVLEKEPQTQLFTIANEGVYYFMIQLCNETTAEKNYITVDVQFANVDGLLDMRVMPIIDIKYACYPVFALLTIAYVIWLIVKSKKSVMPIQIVLSILPVVYIMYCLFTQLTLIRQNESDSFSSLSIGVQIFGFVYEMMLFIIIVFASSGWCLLNVEIPLKRTIIGCLCVCIYVGSSYLFELTSSLAGQLIMLCGYLIGATGVMYTIWLNTNDDKQQIKAHLMVIENNGIMPQTTPIYQKFKLYSNFVYSVGCSIYLFILIKTMLVLLGHHYFMVGVLDAMQFAIITMLMFLYRPHGSEIDAYMRRYSGDGEREEVDLDDLSHYDVEGANDKDGMREWEDGMNLPLEPLIVSSSQRSKKPILGERAEETPYIIQQPLNDDDGKLY